MLCVIRRAKFVYGLRCVCTLNNADKKKTDAEPKVVVPPSPKSGPAIPRSVSPNGAPSVVPPENPGTSWGDEDAELFKKLRNVVTHATVP